LKYDKAATSNGILEEAVSLDGDAISGQRRHELKILKALKNCLKNYRLMGKVAAS